MAAIAYALLSVRLMYNIHKEYPAIMDDSAGYQAQ